jgi:hypothetical protein
VKKIHICDTADEAYLVRSALLEEGIECEVVNEHLALAYGGIPPNIDTLPAVVLAHDEDAARAKEVVDLFLQRSGGRKAGAAGETPAPTGVSVELILIGAVLLLTIVLAAAWILARGGAPRT